MDVNDQCVSLFKSFINDIIKVFPEYKIKLEDIYSSVLLAETCKIDETELLKEFLERVHLLNKKITNKDETVFNDDPLILTDISFKNIWNTNISYKTKETIWKYLQTFCLISLNNISNKELLSALTELSEDKVVELTNKKLASDVKKIKTMTANIAEPIADDICTANLDEPSNNYQTTQTNSVTDTPVNPLEQLMNNSEIGKLAEQVSKELDIEKMLGGADSDNPMDIISNLMSGGSMDKIMGTIHNIVNSKMDSGELNKESMMNEAQGIYGQLGQNELFQQMTQQMGNPSTMNENPQNNPQDNNAQDNNPQDNNPHSNNKTKARLQKKILEKKKVQVNKVDN